MVTTTSTQRIRSPAAQGSSALNYGGSSEWKLSLRGDSRKEIPGASLRRQPSGSCTASMAPRATFLGPVTAPNHVATLARAHDEFGIATPAERKRIIVQPAARA
jgi:hypothetical protein